MKDTIITACYHYSYDSRMGGRNYTFEFYENPFRNLLSLGMNIVVFSNGTEIEKIKSFFQRNNFENYKVIDYDLNNYRYSNLIYTIKENKQIIDSNGLIPGISFTKNDRNIHLCLSKIDFLKMAIQNEYFMSDRYYWIDAGLFHNGLFPMSFGGCERYLKPKEENFWPENKKNLCDPGLIERVNEKNNNEDLLFIGMTSFSSPGWWDLVSAKNKKAHIVGGIFGGSKNKIIELHHKFESKIEQILTNGHLTLEEDVLSTIVAENNYNFLTFDTWFHDVASDPCYYGNPGKNKSFYKIFMPEIKMRYNDNTMYVFGDSHCCIFLGKYENNFNVVVAGYDGASISGLNEMTSRLMYGKHVTDLVNNLPKDYLILVKLGQVDIEFIMNHKIYVKKETLNFIDFCDSLINKYKIFIGKILEMNKNVIIGSINLPAYHHTDPELIKKYIGRVITNAEDMEIINRSSMNLVSDFSIQGLTKNFMYFNELLRKMANEMNLQFFDTTDSFIDTETGLLKQQFMDSGHHYKGYMDDTQVARQLTINCLQNFLKTMH